MICVYCEKEYTDNQAYPRGYCGTCKKKVDLLPKFREARDMVRAELGLERIGEPDED